MTGRESATRLKLCPYDFLTEEHGPGILVEGPKWRGEKPSGNASGIEQCAERLEWADLSR